MTNPFIRVPASIATFGPALDSIAIALNLALTCVVTVGSGSTSVVVSGVDSNLIPLDDSNLILRIAGEVAKIAGRQLPPLHVEIFNEIPIGRGLGASTAARVAGVMLADSILKLGHTRDEVLNVVARLGGHVSNAAAATFGGCIACSRIDGKVLTVPIVFPPAVRMNLLIKDSVVSTGQSNHFLKEKYSRTDLVSAIGHSSLLVAALSSGNLAATRGVLTNITCQTHYAAPIPEVAEALQFRADGLLGCTMIGSGPSLAVLTSKNHDLIASQVRSVLVNNSRSSWDLRSVQMTESGYCVISGAEYYL